MDDRGIDALRESERVAEFKDAIRVCSSKMSLPLYLVFWFADLLYQPQLKWTFLGLRCIMIPVNLIAYSRIDRLQSSGAVQNLAMIFAFCNSILITIMIGLTGDVASPYYAGLNLVAVGILSFMPWSKGYFYLVVATIFGPFYILSACLYVHGSSNLPGLIISSFFVVGNIVASLVSRHFDERLRKRELSSRVALQDEVESREKIIRDKTEQGLRLASLTKQFSPQVVHAIQSGRLSLINSIHEVQICSVFIDIVDSTSHASRISKEDLDVVISMFMEDTMRVLLLYDITIDKFLGDGVLAFSNDPIQRVDFIQRVVDASLEIRGRIDLRTNQYRTHWGDGLQIRIGIASGAANVGFYGNDDYVKSYTAIGNVVNLASRLCGAATPGQIVVSDSVAGALTQNDYQVSFLRDASLKGFENEALPIYEVVENLARSHDTGTAEILMCPNGHGVLHLDDSTGIFVLMCRTCRYRLDTTVKPARKVA